MKEKIENFILECLYETVDEFTGSLRNYLSRNFDYEIKVVDVSYRNLIGVASMAIWCLGDILRITVLEDDWFTVGIHYTPMLFEHTEKYIICDGLIGLAECAAKLGTSFWNGSPGG